MLMKLVQMGDESLLQSLPYLPCSQIWICPSLDRHDGTKLYFGWLTSFLWQSTFFTDTEVWAEQQERAQAWPYWARAGCSCRSGHSLRGRGGSSRASVFWRLTAVLSPSWHTTRKGGRPAVPQSTWGTGTLRPGPGASAATTSAGDRAAARLCAALGEGSRRLRARLQATGRARARAAGSPHPSTPGPGRHFAKCCLPLTVHSSLAGCTNWKEYFK